MAYSLQSPRMAWTDEVRHHISIHAVLQITLFNQRNHPFIYSQKFPKQKSQHDHVVTAGRPVPQGRSHSLWRKKMGTDCCIVTRPH